MVYQIVGLLSSMTVSRYYMKETYTDVPRVQETDFCFSWASDRQYNMRAWAICPKTRFVVLVLYTRIILLRSGRDATIIRAIIIITADGSLILRQTQY